MSGMGIVILGSLSQNGGLSAQKGKKVYFSDLKMLPNVCTRKDSLGTSPFDNSYLSAGLIKEAFF